MWSVVRAHGTKINDSESNQYLKQNHKKGESFCLSYILRYMYLNEFVNMHVTCNVYFAKQLNFFFKSTIFKTAYDYM